MEIVPLLHFFAMITLSYSGDTWDTGKEIIYYIYRINVSIPVYHCTTECEKSYELSIREKCETIRGPNENNVEIKSTTRSCETSAFVDLVSGDIRISTEKLRLYSKGYYYNHNHSYHVAWNNDDKCNKVDQIFRGTMWKLDKDKHIYIEYNDKKLFINRENTTFCGVTIWKTNSSEIIVSKDPIKTSLNSDTTKRLDLTSANASYLLTLKTIASKQNEQIEELQALLYFLIVFFVIFVLWYIFNTLVNFASLRKLGKRTNTNSEAYLIKCLSQSLTNRYLYFSVRDSENYKQGGATDKRVPQDMYESRENQFYITSR